MCGRYYIELEQAPEGIRELIEAINTKYQDTPEHAQMKLGEVRPGDIVPVWTAQGPRLMRWGFARQDGKGLLINARSETAAHKPTFARSMQSRRIVVPATGYYEWMQPEDGGKKVKYALSREEEALYMAGLWRYEPDQALPTFVILTADAAPNIRFIHDRMPVLLSRKDLRAWLQDDQAALRILRELELQVRFGMV